MTETRPELSPSDAAAASELQGLILPDPALCTDSEAYLWIEGDVTLPESGRGPVRFGTGGAVVGDRYFNLFSLGKWVTRCSLDDLSLRIRGKGLFHVSIWCVRPRQKPVRLRAGMITATEGRPTDIEIPFDAAEMRSAVLFYEIRCPGPGRIDALDWRTRRAPRRLPRIALAITTFRREEAVERTARRFADFMTRSRIARHLTLTVVDNGDSADIETGERLRRVPNENLGGSGGFARGFLEARDQGASHALFMDDDAAIHMESLERTWTFLAHADDPATAVAGAIASANRRTVIWENGAIFDRRCWPLFNGLDLRRPQDVHMMEHRTTAPAPKGHYGGWWYFAFPLETARHLPFPFFVRGDDISFSLVNDFDIVTLPGVLSFQDADFADKESPLTLYLDLRSHLANHLALPSLWIGRWRSAKIPIWFFGRNLMPCHYETLAALNLAIQDVLAGPRHFATHADMADRRAEIGALRDEEKWRPVQKLDPPDRIRFDGKARVPRWIMKLTLNGHLIPFFKLIGNRITLTTAARGNFRHAYGAARITYLDTAGATSYTVHHSKRRAFVQAVAMARNVARLMLSYRTLRQDWHDAYADIASEDWWRDRLGAGDPPPTDAAQPLAEPANRPAKAPA